MNWGFLRIVSDTGDSTKGEGRANTSAASANIAATGAMRETNRVNLVGFEQALQDVSRLPEQFRMVMAPIETAMASLSLMRRQLDNAETQLVSTEQRAANLAKDNDWLSEVAERLNRELLVETATVAGMRQRAQNLDAENARQAQAHNDLIAVHQRTQADLAAMSGQLDGASQQMASLSAANAGAEQAIVMLRADLGRVTDELALSDSQLNSLKLTEKQQRVRFDQAAQSIAELDAALRESDDRYAQSRAAVIRERDISTGLRTELNHARHQFAEVQARLDSQTEAASNYGSVQEQRLDSQRARLAEVEQALAIERRERRERDLDLARLKAALETAQRSGTDMRGQLVTASETQALLNRKLNEEGEMRRTMESQLDAIREQTASVHLDHRAAVTGWRGTEKSLAETVQALRQRLAEVESDNDRLRTGLSVVIPAPDMRQDAVA